LRRNATLLVVLGLLAGSALAFGVAERLKLEKSPVAGTEVDKVFSPVCRCPQRRARVAFRLRHADRLTLSLLDSEGKRVRTLVDGDRYNRGAHHFFWNGRDDDGKLLPEGRYRPKVVLGNADRTIVLPNPIRVDVTRPSVAVASVKPRLISPDGDGYGDVVRVRYRANERVRGILLVNGQRRILSSRQRPTGQLEWRAGGSGVRTLPPGTYRLAVKAQDLAGNLSKIVPAGRVKLRYIGLSPLQAEAKPGARVSYAVAADAPRVHWVLRRGSSVVKRGLSGRKIRLRAPNAAGRYVLTARVAGHRSHATLVVRKGT
jgi:hypothetical protein